MDPFAETAAETVGESKFPDLPLFVQGFIVSSEQHVGLQAQLNDSFTQLSEASLLLF